MPRAAGPADVVLQRVHHVLLGVRFAERGGEHAKRALGHPNRLANLLDLGGVLDDSLGLDNAIDRHERDLRCELLERFKFAERDAVPLDADRLHAGLGQHLGGGLVSRLVVPADVGVDRGALFLDLLLKPRIADEDRMSGRAEVETRIAREARQIRDVDGRGDEKAIDRVLLQALDKCLTPLK